MKRCPTMPVAPSTATGIRVMLLSPLPYLAPFFLSFMAHQGNDRRDQVAVQAAQSPFAIFIFHDQNDARIRGSLADDRNAFACQRGDGPGGTHGINREAGTDAGAGSQSSTTADAPASHIVLQQGNDRIGGAFLYSKGEVMA